MKRHYQWMLIGVTVAIAGVAVWEDLERRKMARRYYESVEQRAQLEQQVDDVTAAHARLKVDFQDERQRAKELAETLTTTRMKLDDTAARLAQEAQRGRELQTQMAAMEEQMDQLQGELALALEERRTDGFDAEFGEVQLERILVSDFDTSKRGRVMSVHQDWDFVVINLGWDDVQIGDTVSIVRDQEVMAQARVDRVQEGVCAATILPDWEMQSVRVNDAVEAL